MSTKNKNSGLVPRSVSWVKQFKKDYKAAAKKAKADLAALRTVMQMIEHRETLPPEFRDHPLTGRYPRREGDTNCRECHVGNDWLLIYRFPDDGTVEFVRTGTHSDLFG